MAQRIEHRDVKHVRQKRVTFSKSKREFIFKRDNYCCQLCKKDLTNLPEERVIDHKEPLSKLGSNQSYNLWLLCDECDKEKSNEILPEVIVDRMQYLKQKYPYLK